jgi:hypothetical protein
MIIVDPSRISIKQNIPGPGTYRVLETNPVGKYVLSNVPNSRAAVWGPLR